MPKHRLNSSNEGDNSGSKIRKIAEVNDDASSTSHASSVRSSSREPYSDDSSSSQWSVASSVTAEVGTTNDDVIDGDWIAELREMTPKRRGLEPCPSEYRSFVDKCIEKIHDESLTDVKPGKMYKVKIRNAKGYTLEARVDSQRHPYATDINGVQKRFAILAAQVEKPMFASAHVEIGPKFGFHRIQGALKKSLQRTVDTKYPGRAFRLTATPKSGKDAVSPSVTPTNSPKPVPRTAKRRSAESVDVKNKQARRS